MNKVRCAAGHFYNADKFAECPQCLKDQKDISYSPFAAAPVSKTASPTTGYQPRSQTDQSHPIDRQPDRLTQLLSEPLRNPETIGSPNAYSSDMKTIPLYETNSNPLNVEVDEASSIHKAAPSSLRDAINAVVSHTDAVDVKTVAFFQAPSGTEPVVGWLVCVKGEYFGQSFHLKAGNNFVGRAMNMDIALAQETSVSRNRHCVITFDPTKLAFYVQQGESSGLTYLNGEMVMSPTRMNPRDLLKLGHGEFLLVPLCGDGFRWEDYSN